MITGTLQFLSAQQLIPSYSNRAKTSQPLMTANVAKQNSLE